MLAFPWLYSGQYKIQCYTGKQILPEFTFIKTVVFSTNLVRLLCKETGFSLQGYAMFYQWHVIINVIDKNNAFKDLSEICLYSWIYKSDSQCHLAKKCKTLVVLCSLPFFDAHILLRGFFLKETVQWYVSKQTLGLHKCSPSWKSPYVFTLGTKMRERFLDGFFNTYFPCHIVGQLDNWWNNEMYQSTKESACTMFSFNISCPDFKKKHRAEGF